MDASSQAMNPKLKFTTLNMIYALCANWQCIFLSFMENSSNYILICQRNSNNGDIFISEEIIKGGYLYSQLITWIKTKMMKFTANDIISGAKNIFTSSMELNLLTKDVACLANILDQWLSLYKSLQDILISIFAITAKAKVCTKIYLYFLNEVK